jgi:CheY-like chemotaxis protein
MTTIRVVLADDHRVVREGLRYLLNQETDIEIVGEAGDGAQTLTVVRATRPDALLLDLYMPGLDGHGVIAALRDLPNPPTIVVLTSATDDEHLVRAVEAEQSWADVGLTECSRPLIRRDLPRTGEAVRDSLGLGEGKPGVLMDQHDRLDPATLGDQLRRPFLSGRQHVPACARGIDAPWRSRRDLGSAFTVPHREQPDQVDDPGPHPDQQPDQRNDTHNEGHWPMVQRSHNGTRRTSTTLSCQSQTNWLSLRSGQGDRLGSNLEQETVGRCAPVSRMGERVPVLSSPCAQRKYSVRHAARKKQVWRIAKIALSAHPGRDAS